MKWKRWVKYRANKKKYRIEFEYAIKWIGIKYTPELKEKIAEKGRLKSLNICNRNITYPPIP